MENPKSLCPELRKRDQEVGSIKTGIRIIAGRLLALEEQARENALKKRLVGRRWSLRNPLLVGMSRKGLTLTMFHQPALTAMAAAAGPGAEQGGFAIRGTKVSLPCAEVVPLQPSQALRKG